MKRCLFNGAVNALPRTHYDVIIVGAGLAGLYTALNLENHLSCAIVIKGRIGECNSYLAQGGIAAVTHGDDSVENHLNDTLAAGAHFAEKDTARMMIEEGPQDIEKLTRGGIVFDKKQNGQPYLTREGGHTKNRVLHCGGDATGRQFIDTLSEKIKERKATDLLEHCFLTDIVTDTNGQVTGIIALQSGTWHHLISSHVVICTGGTGALYRHTTNQAGITGDGIAAALRAGAHCRQMEFVQFHPTAFYDRTAQNSLFLVSEAVRGEGGILKNSHGKAFMEGRHPMKDLAPRDMVAREIFLEMQKHGDECVYLDITHQSEQFLASRFPTIYQKCLEKGINISKDLIPVAPVQHYFMGGIQTDSRGRTNLPGLYAAGEAACTAVHGANRLASNSLLECLVFGRRCAEFIGTTEAKNASTLQSEHKIHPNKESKAEDPSNKGMRANASSGITDIQQLTDLLKKEMQTHVGIVRTEKDLKKALKKVNYIFEVLNDHPIVSTREAELVNMATVAREIIHAAINRKESIGAHYRVDTMI